MGFEGFPFVLGWELTLACNLRCRHCGSAAGAVRPGELTLEEALNLCDQLPPLLVQEVDFTGGEPLLHRDWQVIVDRLHSHHIRAKMLTNGLILQADTIRRLRESEVEAIGISLDGLETTHDHLRESPGLFRKVMTGIERLRAAGMHITIITTVNRTNIDELPALMTLLGSAGIEQWQVQPIFSTGRAVANTELQLSPTDYLKLGAFVKGQSDTARESGIELRPGDSFGYYTDCDTRTPPWRGCPAGLVSCGITSDGKVKGCLSMPGDLIEGDLRQRDLWDIWFDPEGFAYTRRYTRSDLGPHCLGCDKADLCQGGCTTMSYGSTGRCHNDPLCFYAITNGAQRLTAAPENR